MGKQEKQKATQAFRLIPEYREKIDIHKICQALIMTAKDKPGKAKKPRINRPDKRKYKWIYSRNRANM